MKIDGGDCMPNSVYDELVRGIIDAVGKPVQRIVLYGSVARGTNSGDSDIDIAVIMDGQLSSETEDRLSDFIVEMNLKYDKVFSVIDIDSVKFESWKATLPFYRNVDQEGINLWKVA